MASGEVSAAICRIRERLRWERAGRKWVVGDIEELVV